MAELADVLVARHVGGLLVIGVGLIFGSHERHGGGDAVDVFFERQSRVR